MDRTVEIEELLSHAGWLRKLAAGLVADAPSADDLVQRRGSRRWWHPPRAGEVRPWLARAAQPGAQRAARRAEAAGARDRQRRRRLERAPRGPDALAQDAETQRQLAEAVTRLAEPLRSVVAALPARARLGGDRASSRCRQHRALVPGEGAPSCERSSSGAIRASGAHGCSLSPGSRARAPWRRPPPARAHRSPRWRRSPRASSPCSPWVRRSG